MIGVIFWSGTGNTERMAYEVAEGIKAAGQEVEVKSVSEVSVDEAAAYEKLALGCADMGAEQLEAVSYTHLAFPKQLEALQSKPLRFTKAIDKENMKQEILDFVDTFSK